MKYIRTKDGIYVAAKINGMVVARGNVGFISEIANVYCPIVFKEKDIVKKADIIEELCDEYVIVPKDKEENKILTIWHTETFSLEEVKQMIPYETIYGAIWTDKGLIYVAKMNEKGELELL